MLNFVTNGNSVDNDLLPNLIIFVFSIDHSFSNFVFDFNERLDNVEAFPDKWHS